jgi:hypothetical protein
MIQVAIPTTKVVSKPCHHAPDAGFTGMQNVRALGSWRLPPRFQRKVWEVRKCIAQLEFLWAASDVWSFESEAEWRPQEVGDAWNIKWLLRTGCWWLTPVILATHEAEIRRLVVQSQPGKIVYETLSQKTLHKNRTGVVAQGEDPEFKP